MDKKTIIGGSLYRAGMCAGLKSTVVIIGRMSMVLHGAAVQDDTPDHASGYKARLGVVLFSIYAIIYAGFVAINIVDATLMGKKIFMGLNLAIVYGFGLIALALIMALIYNRMCSLREKQVNTPQAAQGEDR